MNGFSSRIIVLGLVLFLNVAHGAEGVAQYMREAQDYFAAGKLQAAAIQLKNVLQSESDHGEARLLLGRIYLELGDGAGAEKELEHARAAAVEEAAVLLPLLGRAWLMQGRADTLLENLPLLETGAASARAERLSLRGQARLLKGEKEAAGKLFAQALALDAKRVDSIIGQARLLFADGDRAGAAERTEKALEVRPDYVEAWILSGELRRLEGDAAGAVSRFQQALELRPDNLAARLGRAASYTLMGELERSNEDLEWILAKVDKHPLANYLKGLNQYQTGAVQDAITTLQQVLNVLPGHAPSELLIGTLHYQQGQFNQSIHYLGAYLEKVPNHVPALKLYGASLLRAQELDRAVEALKKAVAAAPEDPQLLALLGGAYLAAGQGVEGLQYLERAAEIAPDAAAVHAQLAVGHLVMGDASQAASALENAVDLGQGLIQADVLLVLAQLKSGAIDKAHTAAQTLADKQPDQPIAFNLLGAVQLAKKQPEVARASFNKALQLNQDFHPARINLARLEHSQGKLDAAAKAYQQVLARNATHTDGLLGMMLVEQARENPDAALVWLEKARAAQPSAVKPNVLLVDHYLRVNEPLKALDVARSFHELQPQHPEALRVLGLAQIATNTPEAAVYSFKRLVSLAPDNPLAHYLLANAALQNQDAGLAMQEFETVVDLDPGHVAARYSLGNLLLSQGKLDAAKELAAALMEQQAELPLGHELMAGVHAAEGAHAKAAEQMGMAYAIQANAQRALRQYQWLKLADEEARGIAVLQDWLTKQPKDAQMHGLLASVLQANGDPDGAIAHYEKILDVAPRSVVALNNLSWLYLDKDVQAALRYAEQAHALKPERAEVLDTYGWVLLKSGASDKGLVFLQEALLKAPHLAEIRYHTAVALHQAGRKKEALRELERSLKSPTDFAARGEAQALLEALQTP